MLTMVQAYFFTNIVYLEHPQTLCSFGETTHVHRFRTAPYAALPQVLACCCFCCRHRRHCHDCWRWPNTRKQRKSLGNYVVNELHNMSWPQHTDWFLAKGVEHLTEDGCALLRPRPRIKPWRPRPPRQWHHQAAPGAAPSASLLWTQLPRKSSKKYRA